MVAWMRPADELIAVPEKGVAMGGPKFVWLKALKASARNCSLNLSDIEVVLNNDKSTVLDPGATSASRPTFPNVPTGGRIKAFGSNHFVGLPRITGPVKPDSTMAGPDLSYPRSPTDSRP